MNRRGFFGMAAGAVAAGPKVAADMAQSAASVHPSLISLAGYSSLGELVSDNSPAGLAAKQLNALRNRHKDQRDIQLRQWAQISDSEIDGLRSIAGWKKQDMRAHAMMRRQEQAEERNLLGIIAGLWE